MTDDLAEIRRRRQARRPVQSASHPARPFPEPGDDRTLIRVDAAAERRNPAAYYAGRAPVRERITIALDMRELYGPEVDQALGGEEPMVDEWESGERVPTLEQVQALAKITDFPVKFFYLEAPPPFESGFICGSDGCHPLGEGPADECPTCGRPR